MSLQWAICEIIQVSSPCSGSGELTELVSCEITVLAHSDLSVFFTHCELFFHSVGLVFSSSKSSVKLASAFRWGQKPLCHVVKHLKMCWCWWLIKERGLPDESYVNRQFILKLPCDITVVRYESYGSHWFYEFCNKFTRSLQNFWLFQFFFFSEIIFLKCYSLALVFLTKVHGP